MNDTGSERVGPMLNPRDRPCPSPRPPTRGPYSLKTPALPSSSRDRVPRSHWMWMQAGYELARRARGLGEDIGARDAVPRQIHGVRPEFGRALVRSSGTTANWSGAGKEGVTVKAAPPD